MSAPETFTCDRCRGTFEKGMSDEEADAEARALYVDVPPGEDASMGVLCHDCWLLFMEWARGQGILKP